MKWSLLTATATFMAAPAMAHVDGSFHSHGIENALVLALLTAGAALWLMKR